MEEINMKYEKFISKDRKSVQQVDGIRLKLIEPWSNCERQLCSCSKPDVPVFRYQCENGGGCGKFKRLDFGCYRLSVGKKPVKTCGDNCHCTCHKGEEE
tara:strand:- start:540 stop:836 length:297 start_codon:yes stop_codon:yes gene_type:complete